MKRFDTSHSIPFKANRVLHCILVALVLIALRVWHLAVIQYDQRLQESRKPQIKTVIEPATRATIRDRFNLPLAINKAAYQATILYSQIKEIPTVAWETNEEGKRVKVAKRRLYIRSLSEYLAKALQLDPDHIEDLIYSRASYYSQIPYVIKDEISEAEYFKLKLSEKDWPGIHTRLMPKRFYPHGRVAADVIGYMGAINRQEYEKILFEIRALEQFIQENEISPDPDLQGMAEAGRRILDLQEKAYSLHDYVGKTGIEGHFEEQLRGFYGKKYHRSDSKGNRISELPGSRATIPGQRIILTLSMELQEYAEQLLAQNEDVRQVRRSPLGAIKKTVIAQKHPWMKGGSIIAMDPQTGEILALASYPRFDPNDFITSGKPELQRKKNSRINRWLENENYIAGVWNQQYPLERERFDFESHQFYDEALALTWGAYLQMILPVEGALYQIASSIETLSEVFLLQDQIDALQELFPNADFYSVMNFLYPDTSHEPYRPSANPLGRQKLLLTTQEQRDQLAKIQRVLQPYFEEIPQNYDKVLLLDLMRLILAQHRFDEALRLEVGSKKVEEYHQMCGHLHTLMSCVKEKAKKDFHVNDFKEWRKQEEKGFLKQKRLEEKQKKAHPKPYLDYLDQEEAQQFRSYWQEFQWALFLDFLQGDTPSEKEAFRSIKKGIAQLDEETAIAYLKSMRSFAELNRPLLGRYRYLKHPHAPLEKDLAAAFYPMVGYGSGRSHAYRQATIQGSLFKLVTAYAALMQSFQKLSRQPISDYNLNPLVIVDQVFTQGGVSYVGYTEEGKAIPQLYKGGRIPRSLAHQHNGRVDLIRALEVSSNPYFSLLAAECLENPSDLAKAARLFSFGDKTGVDLPGEIRGNVPNDLETNRTGLYSMAIGQHTLVVTPLQTAVMLSAIANGGKVVTPKIVALTAGKKPERGEETAPSLINVHSTEVRWEVPMPTAVRLMLLKGLKAAVNKTYQENLASLTRLYKHYPEAISHFTEVKNQLYGKTSTSEVVENIDLDLQDGTSIYTHVWFGGIAFRKDQNVYLFKDDFGQPELVVVVYLKYGGYGKEAAPLAAQIIKKWRDLKR